MKKNLFLLPVRPRQIVEFDSLEDFTRLAGQYIESLDARILIDIKNLYGENINKEKPAISYANYKLELITDKDLGIGYHTAKSFLEVTLKPDHKENLRLKPNDQRIVDYILYSKIVAQAELLEKLTGIVPQVQIIGDYAKRTSEKIKLNQITPKIKAEQDKIGYVPHPTKTDHIGIADEFRPYSEVAGFTPYVDNEVLIILAQLKNSA